MLTRFEKLPPLARTTILITALVLLVVCIQVITQTARGYNKAIDTGLSDASRLAHIQADHVELTFLAVDQTLRRAVERQYFNELFGNNLAQYMASNLQSWADETPQIAAMLVVGPKGEGLIGVHKAGFENWINYDKISFATQPVYLELKDAADTQLAISRLAKVTPDAPDLIVVARRLNELNGDFGGLVVAAISPQYFENFFHSVSGHEGRHMMLNLPDGSVLTSTSSATPSLLNKEISQALDKAIEDQLLSERATTQRPVASAQTVVNAEMKIYAAQMLKNFPLSVSVILDENDFLSGWRSSTMKDLGFLAIFAAVGFIFSLFLVLLSRQIARVQASENSAVLASQAKSEFLANMSHELRTPLNAIIGFSEMMNAGYFGPLNPKQKERVHDINLCGSHLLQLINDILEFSKGEAGKLELYEENFSMQQTILEAQRMMNEKFSTKHIKLLMDIDEYIPDVRADKRKLRQVLLNLLSNAMKFTPEGGLVKVSYKRDAGGNVHITVADNGIGMAEEDLPRALSVFGQVNRDKSHEGTGLGLPLCKMFAELHGGKLAIGSRLGEGTTVRISMPASRVQPRKIHQEDKTSEKRTEELVLESDIKKRA